MKRVLSGSLALAFGFVAFAAPGLARGGIIADENANPGAASWEVKTPGNAQHDGSVDTYPAKWSIARGESVAIKVRSSSSFRVTVYRLGWYDGTGAREMASAEHEADPQPYPSGADPDTGLIAAGWHDSVTFATDGSWTPGFYVARVDAASGKQAMTFFTVRDDGATPKMPLLLIVTTGTHQAYNGWPGPGRGGKSLYGFNSSSSKPRESWSQQAVKVSLDRPFLVGWGSGDVLRYEYPFIRWAEKNGYDLAYATDDDVDRDPTLVEGRRAILISGHWEYVSGVEYDAVERARDAGTSLMVMSGDTMPWHVRYEDGGRTMVGYKESWKNDPEHKAGVAAVEAGDIEEAKRHFANVTRGWKRQGYHPHWGIDLRRPPIGFLGVQSAGAMGPSGPWGDLKLDTVDPWFFEGTGFKKGDLIKWVMGYEYDSTYDNEREWDSFRIPGLVKLGALLHRKKRNEVGGAAYHKHPSGADVVAFGAVNFAWALDDYASTHWGPESVDPRVQKLVSNLLNAWVAGAPTPGLPPVDGGAPGEEDGGPPGTSTESSPQTTSGGCAYGAAGASASVVLGLAAGGWLAVLRRRRLR